MSTVSMSVSNDVAGEPSPPAFERTTSSVSFPSWKSAFIMITLMPAGVEKDPERVNRAVEAFETANANARDALRALVNASAPGGDPHERALAYYDGRKALTACDEAQEEFFRAVAGVPARGGR